MLPRANRLRAQRDFKRAYSRGRSCANAHLALYTFRTGAEVSRFGFSVSKKVGNAAVRNRIKRRLREAVRATLPNLSPGFDVVIIARSRAAEADFADLLLSVNELCGKSRMFPAPGVQDQRPRVPPERKAPVEQVDSRPGDETVGSAQRFCIGIIRLYQRTSRFRPRTCRFTPTCSEYAAQAIAKHGVVRGVIVGMWRIARCNPFHPGGHDPVK